MKYIISLVEIEHENTFKQSSWQMILNNSLEYTLLKIARGDDQNKYISHFLMFIRKRYKNTNSKGNTNLMLRLTPPESQARSRTWPGWPSHLRLM